MFSRGGIKQMIPFVNKKNDLVFGTCVVLEVKLEEVISDLQITFLQLIDWLDLSLNHSVPSSLLILSR